MRRNDKTRHEWRKAYKEKEELMIERGYPEVSPHDFYRELLCLICYPSSPPHTKNTKIHKKSLKRKIKHFRGGGGVLVLVRVFFWI